MSKQNRDGFVAFVEDLKSTLGTFNDDQQERLRQKARRTYGLTAKEAEQILEDLGIKVINYFEVLGLTIAELENHSSEETVKKRVEDAWFPPYNKALKDHTNRGVERRNLLNKAKKILIDPQKRQIHIAQIKSISGPDPIIKFRTGETATSVGELVSLMEQHSAEAVAALYRNEITQGLDQFGEKHFSDVARAVVSQFSVDRQTGFMVLIAVLRGKIRLENGSEAGTPQELARLIDQNWEQSQKLLYNGFITFWFEHTKQSQIARTAKDITNCYRSKQDIGLEEFVQKLDPQIGKPKLQVNPSQIDFGSMDTESQKTVDIKITNRGRGFLYGDVQVPIDMPGLQVSDTKIQGGGVVSVKLDASQLTSNEMYQTTLGFRTNGGVVRVPVSGNVTPKPASDVKTKNADGNTPLHFAAREGDHKRVEMLLSHGAEVNAKDKYGETPLHVAAMNNASDTAEILLKNGADINAKNNRDETPLNIASNENASETEAVLRKYGRTRSSEKTFEEFVEEAANAIREKRVLYKYGETMPDVNTKDADGNTPLHFAAHKGDHKKVEVLLKNGADVNAENKKGTRPLHLAAERNADTVMEVLLKNGADVNVENKHSDTPLHSAAYYNADKAIGVLLKNGADINANDYIACTPLHDTAHQDAVKAVEVLLKNGADVEGRRDADRWDTPLHKAALYNAHKTAEVLLRNGADVNAKNSWGETPLRVAVNNSSNEVVKVLRRYGGKKGIFR